MGQIFGPNFSSNSTAAVASWPHLAADEPAVSGLNDLTCELDVSVVYPLLEHLPNLDFNGNTISVIRYVCCYFRYDCHLSVCTSVCLPNAPRVFPPSSASSSHAQLLVLCLVFLFSFPSPLPFIFIFKFDTKANSLFACVFTLLPP